MSRFDTAPTREQITDAATLLLRYPDRLRRLAYIAGQMRQHIDTITHISDRAAAGTVAWLRALNLAYTETRNQ
jgi:hypothetical protein